MTRSKYGGAPFFTAGDFTATPLLTPEDKARLSNRIALFLLAGCPQLDFDRPLWEAAHRLFGHMAHQGPEGFWQEWFSSSQRQVAYLESMLAWPCYGDPSFLPCDVEQRLKDWVLTRGLLDALCDHTSYLEAA